MKKALALVLALVLALSMAVSAFALTLKDLTLVPVVEPGKTTVTVVDAKDEYALYTHEAGTYYIALEDKPWTDVKVTANGNVTAELVKYDPEKMIIVDENNDRFDKWDVTYKGERRNWGPYTYEEALLAAKTENDAQKVSFYGIKCVTNVNIIKITIADNYTASFTEGKIVIDAKLDGKAYQGVIKVINDVIIFEYEEVKWAAANAADKAAIAVGDNGYSDYDTYCLGYDLEEVLKGEYDVTKLRNKEEAAVVCTTAFRAIEGKNLNVKAGDMLVTIEKIAKGQKGVNFRYYGPTFVDAKKLATNVDDGDAAALVFGFYGKQVVASDWTIALDLGYDWFELREIFGRKVEEDDIVTFYLLKDGKVIKEYKVDYMTANPEENVELEIKGSNSTLGQYELVLEVPAVEGEKNPNTGAESVVGVVAALAVVSLASAAAVSLKK